MAVRPILIYGDPRLHEIADPVEKVDDEIRELVDDMFETKMANNGIGLAATQLGIKKSLRMKVQWRIIIFFPCIGPLGNGVDSSGVKRMAFEEPFGS